MDKGTVSSFVRKDISNEDYIKSFQCILNPNENGGESITLIVDLYNNGDGEKGYWTQTSIETNCYGNSCTKIWTSIQIEDLKKAVDEIYVQKLRNEKLDEKESEKS